MKEVTESRLTHILAAHPNAVIEDSADGWIVRIPMYDIEQDRAWFEELRVIKDPDVTPVGIVPVFNVRKGATFNPDGEARESPLGHLYRIVGWSPPPEDRKDK